MCMEAIAMGHYMTASIWERSSNIYESFPVSLAALAMVRFGFWKPC